MPSDSPSEADHPQDVTPVGVTGEGDLDPVALDKAFRFAAWSSVTLVSYHIVPRRPSGDS
jgi:hypothetical protein